MKTIKMAILLIVTVTMNMTAQIIVGTQTPIKRVSYENKIYTVHLGKITYNGQGNITVEILTDEKIEIPIKSGSYLAPIMAKIEAGGKTFVTGSDVEISDNSMLFNFGAMPDKVIVYGNDGNANGLTATFYVNNNNSVNTQQPQQVIVQPQSPVNHMSPTQQQSASHIYGQNNGQNNGQNDGQNNGQNNGQNSQQIYLGFGYGFDYGGVGGKVEYLPVKNFGLFGGLGYNLLSVGWNVGATYKILPDNKISPNLMLFYGYNGVSQISGAPEYNMTSYGVTIGGSLDIKVGSKGNKLSVGLFVPIRSQKFMDNYDAVKNNPNIEVQNDLVPVAFSVGYNILLK